MALYGTVPRFWDPGIAIESVGRSEKKKHEHLTMVFQYVMNS